MNWYEICLHRYPRKYMTRVQLDRVFEMGLIFKEQYDEILAMVQFLKGVYILAKYGSFKYKNNVYGKTVKSGNANISPSCNQQGAGLGI